jgi:hypothetical protein
MFTPEEIQKTSDSDSNSESNYLGINNVTQDVIVGYFLIYTAGSRMEKKYLLERNLPNSKKLPPLRLSACQAIATCLAHDYKHSFFAKTIGEADIAQIFRFETLSERNLYISIEGGSVPKDDELLVHMATIAAHVNF